MCCVCLGNGSNPEIYFRLGFPDIISSHLKVHYRAPASACSSKGAVSIFQGFITQPLKKKNSLWAETWHSGFRPSSKLFLQIKKKSVWLLLNYRWAKFYLGLFQAILPYFCKLKRFPNVFIECYSKIRTGFCSVLKTLRFNLKYNNSAYPSIALFTFKVLYEHYLINVHSSLPMM